VKGAAARRPPSVDIPRVAALAAAALVLMFAFGCGDGGEGVTVADVAGTPIKRESVDSLIKLYTSRAEAEEGEREGEGEIDHADEVAALHVLVQRAVLAHKARQLGVTVDSGEIERRTETLRGREEAQEGHDEADLEEQLKATAEAQLLYEALYRRVTRHVHVARSRVLAYYRSHRSSYPSTSRLPPRDVSEAITRGLLEIERNKAMARWAGGVQRELSPRIDYREGWAPTASP
jgi:hypothetical protein